MSHTPNHPHDPARGSYELRREVRFEPGFDLVEETDGRYGRSSMLIRFVLHGPDGCVQFVMSTGWLPSHVMSAEWGDQVDVRRPLRCLDGVRPIPPEPMATDLGHHWRTPSYEDEYQQDHCDVIDGGGPCFYDGSSLNAEPVMAALFQRGDEAVWEALTQYYGYCVEQAETYHQEAPR